MTSLQFYFLEFSAIYILLAWAIYLPFRADQPYFGPFYSMCLGAYFAAYTSVNWGWPLWLVLIGAVALCVLFSFLFKFDAIFIYFYDSCTVYCITNAYYSALWANNCA